MWNANYQPSDYRAASISSLLHPIFPFFPLSSDGLPPFSSFPHLFHLPSPPPRLCCFIPTYTLFPFPTSPLSPVRVKRRYTGGPARRWLRKPPRVCSLPPAENQSCPLVVDVLPVSLFSSLAAQVLKHSSPAHLPLWIWRACADALVAPASFMVC